MKHSKLMLILVLALFAACEEVILIMKMIVFLRKIIIWMVSLRANEKSVHLYTKKKRSIAGTPVLYCFGRKVLLQIYNLYKKGAITKATTDINFNKIFNEGPEVSLNGSPTVSPTTAALCASEPL